MKMRLHRGMPAVPAGEPEVDASECRIAPPVVTDGAARALVMYQRLIESGFDTAQALNGA